MRVLQSLYDGGGGTAPQLAVTRRLVERGHDVRVLAHDLLRSRVESRGAGFTALTDTLPGHDMTRAETDLVRDWEPADPLEAASRFRDLVLFGPALANAREVLRALAEWPADVIVLDWLLFGTALAAEVARLPAVALVHCPYPLRLDDSGDEFFAPGLTAMNDARAALGLGPVGRWDEQLLNVDQVMVLTVAELDPASSRDLPANVTFTGPAFEQSIEVWKSPWPADNDDPLVVISLSTTFMDQRDLASRIMQAVATLPVRALFTTGPSLLLDGLDIPANVEVADFVPHAAVLPQADLVITHAGFGTVQVALAAGVPMVCLPCGRDQPGNAAHLAQLGAGRCVDPATTPDDLRAVIKAALADAGLKRSAQELSRALQRADGVRVVVERVESLAG